MKSKAIAANRSARPPGTAAAAWARRRRAVAWARWGLSLALALGCLAAIGRLALPPAGGGGAPEARLELVRLENRRTESSAGNGPRANLAASAPALPASAPAPPASVPRASVPPASVPPAPAPPVPAAQPGAPAESSPPPDRITQGKAAVAVAMAETAPAPDEAPSPSDAVSKGPQTPSATTEPAAEPAAVARLSTASATAPTIAPSTGPPPARAVERMGSGAAGGFDRPAAAAGEARTGGADSGEPEGKPEGNPEGNPEREVAAERLDAGFALLRPVRPAYPPLARRLGKAGAVRLELAIDPEGRVYRMNVLGRTGVWGFGRSVERAYRAARFTRPTVRGRPVSVLWRKTVIFRP